MKINFDPARLRDAFDYDSVTGVLTWRNPPHAKIQRGAIAGTVQRGYRSVVLDQRRIQVHRIIWCLVTGQDIPAGKTIDHANCDGTDNRWKNLRLATREQNGGNARPQKRDLPKGVHAHKRHGVILGYRAFISAGAGRNRYLGLFDTPSEAHDAYRAAAQLQYGEFARAA